MKEAAQKSSITQARAVWRAYSEKCTRQEISPDLRLGVAASFTVDTLIPHLGAYLVSAGLHPEIKIGPFNQIFQICLDHRRHFGDSRDAIVLLWRIEDIMLDEIGAFLRGAPQAVEHAQAKVGLLGQAIMNLRATYAGSIVVNIPPFPSALPAHALDLTNPLGLGSLYRIVTSAFVELTARLEGVRLMDLDGLQREFGLAASFDSRQWYLYRQPFTERFLFEMGTLLGRILAALRRSPRKCIVLDCDNTLWGGIIGEDGIEEVQIGDEFPGSAYRDFQKLLLHWRQQGVLLALASKNNETDVWEVFDKHTGMVLKREHISAWQINWNPKSDNIEAIAQRLNIGLDSLVFVDDNPMEIDQMRVARPEVHSVLLPEEPADIAGTLRSLAHFDRLDITEEDRQRADMMRAEQHRASFAGQLDKAEFQRSLGLRVHLFAAQGQDLGRIAQLINKTNQFNLSTLRRTVDEVRTLAASSKHRVYGLHVADKFGEYGLTGVVVVERVPEKRRWLIDTLLLSCRVLGRGVETVLLAALAQEATEDGAEEFFAAFIPTAKNAPAAAFLPDHGFQVAEEHWWRIEIPRVPETPSHVTLQRTSTLGAVQGAPAAD